MVMNDTTTNDKLKALAAQFQSFAKGATKENAAELFAGICMSWNMRPDQLPHVVDKVSKETGHAPAAVLMWLDLSRAVVASEGGRVLIGILAAAAAQFAAEAKGTSTTH